MILIILTVENVTFLIFSLLVVVEVVELSLRLFNFVKCFFNLIVSFKVKVFIELFLFNIFLLFTIFLVSFGIFEINNRRDISSVFGMIFILPSSDTIFLIIIFLFLIKNII